MSMYGNVKSGINMINDDSVDVKGPNEETAKEELGDECAQTETIPAEGSMTGDIAQSMSIADDQPEATGENQDEDEKIYSRAQYEALAAETKAVLEKQLEEQVEFYKAQTKKAQEDYAAEKEKYVKSCDWHHRKEALEKRAAGLVGDGSFAKISELIAAYVSVQLDLDKKADIENQYKELERKFKELEFSFQRVFSENTQLMSEKRALTQENAELKKNAVEVESQLQSCQQNLASWESIGVRMRQALIPQCFNGKEWFDNLFASLDKELRNDPPDDSAIQLIASVAEFAVLERNPVGVGSEWKKQLSDIGLVVANYMHQKKVAEGEVVKMLRNFAMALRESPTVVKLKISMKIPQIGPDFNVDEVKHLKNGSAVAKIHNWCLIDSNGVFSKAIVE